MLRPPVIALLCLLVWFAPTAAANAPPQSTPQSSQKTIEDAQHEYDAGRYSRAVDTLTAAAAQSPGDAQLHFLLGQSYYQLREFSRAVTSLERSVQLAPNRSEAHDWLGKAYGRRAEQSNFLSAFSWARKTHKEFETAVRLDPSNFEAQRDLIRYEAYAPKIVGGGDDRALEHIEGLEKIDFVQGQLARGEFLTIKKRLAEADAIFQNLLQSNSNRIGVWLEVAEFFRDRQNSAKMREALDLAARIDGNDRRMKYYRGTLLVLEKSNPAEAEALLKSYLATVPNHSDLPPHSSTHEWLGKLYEGLERFSEAAAEYRASLALDPGNKSVQDALKRVQNR